MKSNHDGPGSEAHTFWHLQGLLENIDKLRSRTLV